MNKQLPLVVILGSTGSGKTKLSLELAQKFNGEIIGADAMQMYKGLDIITAKVTKAEKEIAPHHMIDILEPHEIATVIDYRNRAVQIIDDLLEADKLPIVVGGTNYYIESLLWRVLIGSENTSITSPSVDNKLEDTALYEKLQALDPNMAKRLHPNNRRKILRALEVFAQSGRQMSEILEKQRSAPGGSNLGGGLRYNRAIIFHLTCDQDVLDLRLNKRVDMMLEQGLIQELLDFHEIYNRNRIGKSTDYTRGIFQSIGFKEFHNFLMLPPNERSTQQSQALFNECVSALKTATRRYARKQTKWTRNRFLGCNDRETPPMYGLDVTNLDHWNNNVLTPAVEIIESSINCSTPSCCKYEPLPKITSTKSESNAVAESYFCEICERIFVGKLQWHEHLKSNKHKKMIEHRSKNSRDKLKIKQ